MSKTTFQTKETDSLSEAYTLVDNIASKLFQDPTVENEDAYQFLRSITVQINLFRVNLIKARAAESFIKRV